MVSQSYVTMENRSCVKRNSVNLSYLPIHEINRYTEEGHKNKDLKLVPTYESRDKIMRNHERKSEMLLGQYLITPTITNKNI